MAIPSEPCGRHYHSHAKRPGAGRFRNVASSVAPASLPRSAGTPIPVAVPIVRAAWPVTVAATSPATPAVLAVGSANTCIARQRRRRLRSSALGLLAVGAGLAVLFVALAYSAWSAKGDLAGIWKREPSNRAAMSSAALPLVPPPGTGFVAEDALLAACDQPQAPIAPTEAAHVDAGMSAAILDSPGSCAALPDMHSAASGNQEFTAEAWVAQLADRGMQDLQDLDQSPCEPSETLPSLLETTLGKLGNNLLLQSQAESRLWGTRKRADGGRAQVPEPVATEDLGIFSRPPASFDYRRQDLLEDAVGPAAPGS